MILNKKNARTLFSGLVVSSAILLSACQNMPLAFLTPESKPKAVETSVAAPVPAPAQKQEKTPSIESLLQNQQNISIALNRLKENQFTCSSFENSVSVKMTRCQREYNDLMTAKVCTDTIWLEHQNNLIQKSQQFFDCQQS